MATIDKDDLRMRDRLWTGRADLSLNAASPAELRSLVGSREPLPRRADHERIRIEALDGLARVEREPAPPLEEAAGSIFVDLVIIAARIPDEDASRILHKPAPPRTTRRLIVNRR